MDAKIFIAALHKLGANFFTGVPDSFLRPFVDCLMNAYGISCKHIVAANEGAAVGLAAGHYLATSEPSVVYMQNSGIGNAVNPICSLLNKKVFSIPVIFVIGWRGEPGKKDEPQHIFQGEVTLPLLDCLKIPYFIISNKTGDEELLLQISKFKKMIDIEQSVAFVIKENAILSDIKMKYSSESEMSREAALNIILSVTKPGAVFVCTTGKLSREVYEIRELRRDGHSRDFLTIGSMGHSIMIALGIAMAKPDKRVFCLDGDGSTLMHMGSLAVAGIHASKNLTHIVVNNGAHETVGRIPAVSAHINLAEAAGKLGYKRYFRVVNEGELIYSLATINNMEGPVFIEIICNLFSRTDLCRPAITPIRNKKIFMSYLCDKIDESIKE